MIMTEVMNMAAANFGTRSLLARGTYNSGKAELKPLPGNLYRESEILRMKDPIQH